MTAVVLLAPGSRLALAADSLADGFQNPPDTTKPWCYWYWISDNISREGITHDLEAMKRVGIGEAFIGNVDVDTESRGSVKVLSEEWWQLVDHAIREGQRLGVDIGMFNCPGWSQSGGPWVQSTQTMRYLAQSVTRVEGPLTFTNQLPVPREPFQDVAVLAFPAPQLDGDTIAQHSPQVQCTPPVTNADQLCDGKLETTCAFPAGGAVTVDITVPNAYTARSLTLHPPQDRCSMTCELKAETADGQLQSLRTFVLDRSNPNPNVGPVPFAPVTIAFPAVTSRHFQLIFTKMDGRRELAEIELSAAPRLERYAEKQLDKMFQSPQPMWDDYLWPAETGPYPALAISPTNVLNLTKFMSADGTLHWQVPAGPWIILRTGMTPTGVSNAPASPEATGYEIDKMNRQWVNYHFEQFIGKELARLPAAERKSFRHVVADSYEMGPENWTDGLAAEFQKVYGYDPLPWLPVLTGRIVGSADQSDRFLWDLRRLVADKVSYDYVGGLRQDAEKHGLRLWLENYGHWGYPGEMLQYGGQSSDLSGEFWTGGDLGSIELRDAASAAHIYGKPVVTAESWTSGGPHWALTPWELKLRGDWAMTEGINHFLLHVYIHQPYDDKFPGVNAWFGTEFNHHNTWFAEARDWVAYLKRSSFLLQQGHYVADVAYFIGEDAPKMTGTRQPALPPGYSFDYVNAEAIARMKIVAGRYVLPDGMSYRLLVLPPLESMRPELLTHIRDLVQAGGSLLGPKPDRSPSLANYPAADAQVKKLAAEIWQDCDGQAVTEVHYGRGRVFSGLTLQPVLDRLAAPADVTGLEDGKLPWIHRGTADADIYFISNQRNRTQTCRPGFRVSGKQPELWDAVTGTRRDLPEYATDGTHTYVPLKLAARQSVFVVFQKSAAKPKHGAQNFPEATNVGELTGPWEVAFDPRWGGPQAVTFDQLTDWTQRPEPGIKYYSGTAVYRKTFDLPAGASGRKLLLDLGAVHDMARVRLNGQDLGLVWCAPWQRDITAAVRPTGNQLELEVVNTWANRLIGDASLPPDQRLTWTAVGTSYDAKSRLRPAGLIGPVSLLVQP
ncbi:MAG TPA: glycosyl hydrolase [Dongiaceae bacterium]|nr:glycosyl hydrolase [Dongiaceae bacterium]